MDTELVFNSVESVPNVETVANTLIEAASSNSSDLSGLEIDISSIKAKRKMF